MSYWTHISGVLKIQTAYEYKFYDDKDRLKLVENLKVILDNNPVTGSECDMWYYINYPPCSEATEFSGGKSIELGVYVYVTIIGNLRDRVISETKAEFMSLVEALEKENFYIDTWGSVCYIRGYDDKIDVIELLEELESERA